MPRPFSSSLMTVFASVSSAEVYSSMPNKSSLRDVLPTLLLNMCPEEVAPLIAHLTNQSLTDGKFPHLFKLAQVLASVTEETRT